MIGWGKTEGGSKRSSARRLQELAVTIALIIIINYDVDDWWWWWIFFIRWTWSVKLSVKNNGAMGKEELRWDFSLLCLLSYLKTHCQYFLITKNQGIGQILTIILMFWDCKNPNNEQVGGPKMCFRSEGASCHGDSGGGMFLRLYKYKCNLLAPGSVRIPLIPITLPSHPIHPSPRIALKTSSPN